MEIRHGFPVHRPCPAYRVFAGSGGASGDMKPRIMQRAIRFRW
jgi:hypothetical protein